MTTKDCWIHTFIDILDTISEEDLSTAYKLFVSPAGSELSISREPVSDGEVKIRFRVTPLLDLPTAEDSEAKN